MRVDWRKYNLKEARQIARQGGKTVVEAMMKNIQQFDLVEQSELLQSLRFQVGTQGGYVDKITFFYAWYGVFHEIGIDGTATNNGGVGQFTAKNPNKKMIKHLMEKYSVPENEAFAIGKTILKKGIQPTEWRSKAIEGNIEGISVEFSKFYEKIMLEEIEEQFTDVNL